MMSLKGKKQNFLITRVKAMTQLCKIMRSNWMKAW